MNRSAAVVPVLALALALAGCAAPMLRAGGTPPAARPASASVAEAPAAPPPAARPAPAAAAPAAPDTVPSAEALAVLAGIPEPFDSEPRDAGRAPRVTTSATTTHADAPAEPADADSGRAGIPVPVPVPVLGERPLPEVTLPADTAARVARAVPPAAAPSASAASPPAAAAPDDCWRVQFAAWADRPKAERYLDAARSQLGVPLAIEREAGLFKVRTTGCLEGAAADALRQRAWGAGFAGAFRFRGGRP